MHGSFDDARYGFQGAAVGCDVKKQLVAERCKVNVLCTKLQASPYVAASPASAYSLRSTALDLAADSVGNAATAQSLTVPAGKRYSAVYPWRISLPWMAIEEGRGSYHHRGHGTAIPLQ